MATKNGAGTPRWSHYLGYVKSQSKMPGRISPPERANQPIITISRQAGAGAHAIASELVPLLEARAAGGPRPWAVFDRNIVDRVIEEHHLPADAARFMPEDRINEIGDTLDTLFGLHPSAWSLVRKTAETIRRIANLGNMILFGRAGNVVTENLPNALHVRLVGSVEGRIEYIKATKQLGQLAAADYVNREDLGRKRYVKKYFGKDIDDPLLYHLVINTGQVPFAAAARIIADALDELFAPTSGIQEPARTPRQIR